MSRNQFYGTDKATSISYLEFGSFDLVEIKKEVWDFRLHQKAYDWFMLGRYANDFLTYLSMKNKLGVLPLKAILKLYNQEIHKGNDSTLNLGKLIALAVTKNDKIPSTFYELGQTVFGCIEGMSFYLELLKHLDIEFPAVDLNAVRWYGIDISEMFNHLAVLLHSKYNITTMTDPSALPESFFLADQ